MTPDQEAAAQMVTQELTRGYSDQLIPGAAEQIGKLWGGVGSMPPVQRAEEIARRMASPLVDRFRDPAYDPNSGPTPLERAIAQQGHRLHDGSAEQLAAKWAPELAGRDPVRLAGEVARRLERRENATYLNTAWRTSPSEDRLVALLVGNFGDVMSDQGKQAFAQDRHRQFAGMSDQQAIRTVAQAFRSTAVAAKYGTGATIPGDDRRLLGDGERTTPVRDRSTRTNIDGSTVKATTPQPTPLPRNSGGRFVPGTVDQGGSTPPPRRSSF